jgi:hypothetical protein
MGKSDEYRRNAASCLHLVEKTNDPGEKAFLLDMAQAWNNLADQVDRNSRADLVYETPPPRAPRQPQQPVTQQQQQIQPGKPDKKKEES